MKEILKLKGLIILLVGFIFIFLSNCKKGDKPIVKTFDVTSITLTSAVCGGSIESDGGSTIIVKGVCWSTNPDPTIDDSKTNDGSGAGSFTSKLTGLSPHTKYYVRAYAKNKYGVGYGSTMVFTTTYAVGDHGPAGGLVFYIDGQGGGLEAALSDYGENVEWGCQGSSIGGTSTALSTGQANTTAIVNACNTPNIAARVCNDLEINGFNDWFLPSKDELLLMYENLHSKGLGNFSNSYYWTSSEVDAYRAWYVDFASGNAGNLTLKSIKYKVRAIRKFSK